MVVIPALRLKWENPKLTTRSRLPHKTLISKR